MRWRLASSYNNMSDHIQRLIEAQRELMRAVSHELRTPLPVSVLQ